MPGIIPRRIAPHYARPVATLSLETRRRLTLAATILGSSLAFIDASVVIVALPTIERDLDLGLTGEQWIFLAYSLALAALYLVGGALGDRFGRRRVFFWGVIGFAAASVLAGAAPNGATLIVARVLQGVAGAFLTTNSLALLRAVYAENAGRAIGLWTSFTSVAVLLGPPAGGALVEWVSWRWIFFLNLPVAALTLAAAVAGRCDERSMRREGRLDLPGAALSAVGFGALTYALVEGADKGFATVWWAAVLAAAALAAFVWVERRVAEPMLDFKLFRRRNFAAANLETFLVYGALYGQLVYVQLYLQFLGFSPFEASLLGIPASVIMIVLAARFGALADRQGPRLYLTAGPALLGCSLLLLLLVRTRDGLLVRRRALAAPVRPRARDAGRAHHRDGAQVCSAGGRRDRLRHQLDGLTARQPPHRGGHRRWSSPSSSSTGRRHRRGAPGAGSGRRGASRRFH